MQVLVNAYRGGLVESFHTGSVAVADSSGRLVAFAGDPQQKSYLRSAAKPFQTVAMLDLKLSEEYDLSGEEIALACASHGGEPHHIATAAAMLRKGEFDETDLLCGAHPPYDEKAAAELRNAGEEPSPLHNNCSGKHAAMLLATQMLDASPASYLDPDHPLQRRILQVISTFTDLPPEQIPVAVDGCGVPTFHVSLYRTALAFARLGASRDRMKEPNALPQFASHARTVIESMTSFPEYVAGSFSLTTPLMQSFGAQVLGKEGAEAFYGMLVFPTPELAKRNPAVFGTGPVGIALKVSDGRSDRRDPVVLRVLELLGLPVADKPLLQPYRNRLIHNVAGREVGEVRADFGLTFL